MQRLFWPLNRIAAAIVGAAMVGAVFGIVCAAVELWHTPGQNVSATIRFQVYLSIVVALALGTLPGVAALILTPARLHPWRSLPALVIASLWGAAVWVTLLHFVPAENTALLWTGFSLLPGAAGLLAAANMPADVTRYPAAL